MAADEAAGASRTVLVTGGAGYIGSHAVLQLLAAGFRAVVVDSLGNSSELAVRRVAALAGDQARNLSFHKVDIRDKDALEKVFASTRFDAVVHFAGLKAVGESVQKPLLYYDHNVAGTINLLGVMAAHGCKKVRDYIHVVDLAEGHIVALRKLFENTSNIGCEAYNLGTGKGTSVLEIVNAFEKACGKKIPLVIGQRRAGDAEILFAATAKAERELNWKAKYGITEMCRDQWNWASKNPYGYASPDSTKQNCNSH